MGSEVLKGATAVDAASVPIDGRQIDRLSMQVVVVGAGAVSATVQLEGSNNGTDWVPIATQSVSGTTRAADGGIVTTLWSLVRARVTAISGTNAAVTASLELRGHAYGA